VWHHRTGLIQAGLVAGGVILTVVNAAQLGADPITDGAEAADVTALTDSLADDAGDAAPAACGESFTPGTKVLLASGTAVAIASLKPGDKVLATSTKTGRTQPEPVKAVLINHDTDLYDLTIETDGRTAVIDTTSRHLFWDVTAHRWVRAQHLDDGTELMSPGHAVVRVTGSRVPAVTSGYMWDLTVTSDHDFYVQTAVAAVLVHNCPTVPGGVDNLGNGVKMSTSDALDTAEEFLGEGYQDMGDGRFVNGLRQVRMTDADIADPNVAPHLNFEEWANPIQPGARNTVIFNYHVYLPEDMP
jgi:hypothetical protein